MATHATPAEKTIEAVETPAHMEEAQKLPPGTKGGILGATHEVVAFDPALSRRIARKFDFRILSVFLLINLFSFIDRVNIGNARLLGLQEELKLGVGLRYNIALMCLFVSYCVVELPANMVCKRIGGHIWIPFLVTSFGLVTLLTSVVKTYNGLYAVRFILGCLEGGISPGLVFMLAQFYRRSELGFRTSIYISAASASGAFGGLLAIGFSEIHPWGIIHTWRNIFFFEGLISIVLGAAAFYLIPAGPTEARFLSPEEKVVAVDRLRLDSAGTTEHAKLSMKHVLQALMSPHTLGCGLGFFFGNTTAQSFSVFSPSIIKAMGYTSTNAQLLSVGPYAAACVCSIIVGWLSDRFKKRAILIICSVPVGIIGFFMLEFLPHTRPWAKYGALYLGASGLYSFLPLWLAWAVNNSATPTVRASASGIVFTMGSLGGIIAPWIYLPGDAPQYRKGHAVMLSFLCASWACAVVLYYYSKWENKQRELGKRDYRLNGLTKEQELELSSNHPAFRYFL